MEDKNVICRYWGAIGATFAVTLYFLWVSDKSNSGEADRNMIFYIGGCALYFIIYILIERIWHHKKKINITGIWCATIVFICITVFWIIYSYIKDPELFPTSSWGIHNFPTILHFIFLIGMVYFGNTIINLDLSKKNTRLRVAIAAVIIIAQVSLLYAPNVFLDKAGGIHHVHAYTNSIVNILSNQPFDESNHSIYGHYALFYGVVVRILGILLGVSDLKAIILAICVFGAVAFIITFRLLDKLIENDAVFCISAIAFFAISTYCYGGGQYYQVLPHRIIFQALILYGAWHSIYVKRNRALLWIMSMCAVIWNIEIGVICCAACFVLESWFDIDDIIKTGKYFRIGIMIAKNLLFMISEAVSAYVVVNIYNLCNGGTWNSIKTFISPLANSKYMLDTLPSPLPDVFAGYFLEIVLFMGVLCYCVSMLISSVKKEVNKNKYIFLIFNSLIGLGSLIYYMNRAARTNLYITHVELIVLLTILADQKAVGFTLRHCDFSVKHVKQVVKIFSMIILITLVLDSVRYVGKAFDRRIQTTWNMDSLDSICETIQETVPKDTYGFGLGVPELYSAMGRKTGVYVGDYSDYSLFDMSKVDEVIADSDHIFVNKKSFEKHEKRTDYICIQSYEINGTIFGLYVKNTSQLTEGSYIISAKQDDTQGICTNGSSVFLGNEPVAIRLSGFELSFDNGKVLDVSGGKVDSNGTVQLWEKNNTEAQKWLIEEVDGYYMIGWYNYALTYNVEDNSIKLTTKTGEDNQLWSFTN